MAPKGSGKSHSTGAILEPFINLEEEEKKSFNANKKENKKRKRDKKAAKKNAGKRNLVQNDLVHNDNVEDDDEAGEEDSGCSGEGDERKLYHKKTRMVDLVNKHFIIIILNQYTGISHNKGDVEINQELSMTFSID